jgi:hypothetical protein
MRDYFTKQIPTGIAYDFEKSWAFFENTAGENEWFSYVTIFKILLGSLPQM